MPAMSANPPPPVVISAMRAPWRDAGWWDQCAMRRKELRLVSSQNTSKSSMLSLKTMPSIAAWKTSSIE